jgi:hypothetical protein
MASISGICGSRSRTSPCAARSMARIDRCIQLRAMATSTNSVAMKGHRPMLVEKAIGPSLPWMM